MQRIICSLLLGITFALLACSTEAKHPHQNTAEASEPLQLTILHINDHHSHLDSEEIILELKTAPAKREDITVAMGGFPRITTAIHELEKESANVLKVHSGDATTGDLYYTLSEGRADADLMNTACFDTLTLGNHEFDNTDAGLKKFIGFLHGGTCRTRVLSANVRFGPQSPMARTNPTDAVQGAVILERQGHKIGVIGLTVAGKTLRSSRPDKGTLLIDETEAAQAEINRLQQQGVDTIILATHIGYKADLALAARLSGVDVIVGGDSHSLLGPNALKRYGISTEGPYPTQSTDRDGKPVCIVQAWQYGYVLGELQVSFDAHGEVTRCAGTPWLLIGDTFTRTGSKPQLSAEETASIRADIVDSGILRITQPDATAAAVLAPYKKSKNKLGSKVIATADAPLCLRRVPGTKRDPSRSSLGDTCNKDERVIAHGGDLQQIVAEAFLQEGKTYFNADISIQNGGGVRADLRSGNITVQDIYTVLPFKNTLIQLNATGAEITAALEDALEGVAGFSGNTGCYPYAGGLRWRVDLNQPRGSRLSHLEVRAADGSYQPLDPAATYRVVTSSFLADGGDSYTALKAISGERRLEVGLDYAQAFLDYINALPGKTKRLNRLPLTEYSTQVFIDTP
jgi:5'-nucleotidase